MVERVGRYLDRLLADRFPDRIQGLLPDGELGHTAVALGGLVDDRGDVFANQGLRVLGFRTVEHGVDHVLQGQDLGRHQPAPHRGNLLLPTKKQPLDGPGPHAVRVQRPEDHVDRHPVGGVADDHAEDRQHPPTLVEGPHRELDQAEQETEVQTGADDELELLRAGLEEQPVEQLLVALQPGDQHVFEVNQVFDVLTNVSHQPLHELRHFLPHPGVDSVLDRLREHLPHAGVLVEHDLVRIGLQASVHDLCDMLGDLFRVHVLEDLPQRSQAEHRLVDEDAGHLARLGGNDALPAEERSDAVELQRLKGQFDRDPVRDPADEPGDERDAEVLPKVDVEKSSFEQGAGRASLLAAKRKQDTDDHQQDPYGPRTAEAGQDGSGDETRAAEQRCAQPTRRTDSRRVAWWPARPAAVLR